MTTVEQKVEILDQLIDLKERKKQYENTDRETEINSEITYLQNKYYDLNKR